jgi:NADH dehydrogenase
VTLVTAGEAGAFQGPRIRRHILGALLEQGINLSERQKITAVQATGVMTSTGLVAADVIIWAGGFHASPLARDAGLQVNERSQVLTDPFLRALSRPRIYAVGDMAALVEEPGAPIRMSLFTALVSGAQAAVNIARDIKGRPLRPLSFAWYGQGIALGPGDAVGFATYPADSPVGPVLRGRPAVFVRNFFVRFLKTALELERRFPGFLFWNGRIRYARQKRERQQQAYPAPNLR